MTIPDSAGELDEILESVFWAGQHNQYPNQNNEPQTSVAEAKAAILALLATAERAGRIDENWKTREYVTRHHYDLSAGRATDEYLEQRINALTAGQGTDKS